MSKRVLLISYYFAPNNVIGAVRPTKLAKYLTRMGYEVTVLCGQSLSALRDPLLQRDLAELADVRVIRERSLFRWWKERGLAPEAAKTLASRPALTEAGVRDAAAPKTAASVEGSRAGASAQGQQAAPTGGSLQKRALNALYLWLFERGDAAFTRVCTRALLSLEEHYDVVFSCHGPLSMHILGRRAKRLHIADRWIADFRDEASVPFRWMRGWLNRYMRLLRRRADAITVVTDGVMRMMKLEAFARVVPNGFDREDVADMGETPLSKDALHFAYCGQLYAGHSDLSPVFAAVCALIDESACEASRVRFHYAGRQGAAFAAQAAAYGLADAVVEHGMLSRLDSLALQRGADALLLATWNTPERTGIVTGKALEYMMADRPVLCCVSGSVKGSEARALVEATGIGVGYEQTSAAEDAPKLKAYLLALYRWRFAGGPSPYKPDTDRVEAFAYPRIAKTIADIIEGV